MKKLLILISTLLCLFVAVFAGCANEDKEDISDIKIGKLPPTGYIALSIYDGEGNELFRRSTYELGKYSYYDEAELYMGEEYYLVADIGPGPVFIKDAISCVEFDTDKFNFTLSDKIATVPEFYLMELRCEGETEIVFTKSTEETGILICKMPIKILPKPEVTE